MSKRAGSKRVGGSCTDERGGGDSSPDEDARPASAKLPRNRRDSVGGPMMSTAEDRLSFKKWSIRVWCYPPLVQLPPPWELCQLRMLILRLSYRNQRLPVYQRQ
ncbi:hypothetical protein SNE40_001592 [Patella caerulea]|uniref:Uncharacterized protein n=1 Tax=Patella caerulea TaxID=87958 RepID=A0AAN8K7F3_PATCE